MLGDAAMVVPKLTTDVGDTDRQGAVLRHRKLVEHRKDGARAKDAGPSGVPERAVSDERRVLEGDGEVLEVRAWRQGECGGRREADHSRRETGWVVHMNDLGDMQ